jgi:hypothetical protein
MPIHLSENSIPSHSSPQLLANQNTATFIDLQPSITGLSISNLLQQSNLILMEDDAIYESEHGQQQIYPRVLERVDLVSKVSQVQESQPINSESHPQFELFDDSSTDNSNSNDPYQFEVKSPVIYPPDENFFGSVILAAPESFCGASDEDLCSEMDILEGSGDKGHDEELSNQVDDRIVNKDKGVPTESQFIKPSTEIVFQKSKSIKKSKINFLSVQLKSQKLQIIRSTSRGNTHSLKRTLKEHRITQKCHFQ